MLSMYLEFVPMVNTMTDSRGVGVLGLMGLMLRAPARKPDANSEWSASLRIGEHPWESRSTQWMRTRWAHP